jgi:hypothetical protein
LKVPILLVGLIGIIPVYPYFFNHFRPKINRSWAHILIDKIKDEKADLLSLSVCFIIFYVLLSVYHWNSVIAKVIYIIGLVIWIGYILVKRISRKQRNRRKWNLENKAGSSLSNYSKGFFTYQLILMASISIFQEELRLVGDWLWSVLIIVWSYIPEVVKQHWTKFGVVAVTLTILVTVTISLRRRRLELKSIDFDSLGKREAIYEVLGRLKYQVNKEKVISYLERNVRKVEGEWPKPDLLAVTGARLGEFGVRLGRLEERWLALN